jgi:hypothetical protein
LNEEINMASGSQQQERTMAFPGEVGASPHHEARKLREHAEEAEVQEQDRVKEMPFAAAVNAPVPRRTGGQGRVKDPARDRRLAENRQGPTGQGRVRNPGNDKRLAENRAGPTGQGRVKNPLQDRRLAENRQGPSGQGRVKNPEADRRLSENREGPTGQGRVKDPETDRRLKENKLQ